MTSARPRRSTVDGRGQGRQRTVTPRHHRRRRRRDGAAPLPTGVTTLAGKPSVGETLTCIPSGFSGNGVELAYEWLRDGAVIADADEAGYELADADLGREVACRVTASNSAGDADFQSSGRTISARRAGDGARAASGADDAGRRPTRAAAAPRLRIACATRSYGVLCTLKATRLLDQGDDPCRRAQAARHGQRPRHGSRTAEGQEGQAHGARRGPLHRGHVDPGRPSSGSAGRSWSTPSADADHARLPGGQPRVPYRRGHEHNRLGRHGARPPRRSGRARDPQPPREAQRAQSRADGGAHRRVAPCERRAADARDRPGGRRSGVLGRPRPERDGRPWRGRSSSDCSTSAPS